MLSCSKRHSEQYFNKRIVKEYLEIKNNYMSNYYMEPRSEMLPFVPISAQKILEIGCGCAEFSLQIKKRQPCEIWGVELDKESAKKAEKIVDNLLCGDISQLLDTLPDAYYDCIVMNDVIEHLTDPESILMKLSSKLNSSGMFVLSVPNVRFWKNWMNFILKKDWKYTESGILDRTHYRFFTKKSLKRMLQQLHFEIQILKGINKTNTWKAKLFYPILPLSGNADTQYLQFACVCKKKH
jgi:2-polyprenyl-3-methyl-5-hydroxy-6-metoxy-1,4-benzoquinol methylase